MARTWPDTLGLDVDRTSGTGLAPYGPMTYYTIAEVARVVHGTQTQVRGWIRDGLPTLCPCGTILVREDSLDVWLRRQPPHAARAAGAHLRGCNATRQAKADRATQEALAPVLGAIEAGSTTLTAILAATRTSRRVVRRALDQLVSDGSLTLTGGIYALPAPPTCAVDRAGARVPVLAALTSTLTPRDQIRAITGLPELTFNGAMADLVQDRVARYAGGCYALAEVAS